MLDGLVTSLMGKYENGWETKLKISSKGSKKIKKIKMYSFVHPEFTGIQFWKPHIPSFLFYFWALPSQRIIYWLQSRWVYKKRQNAKNYIFWPIFNNWSLGWRTLLKRDTREKFTFTKKQNYHIEWNVKIFLVNNNKNILWSFFLDSRHFRVLSPSRK